MADLTDIVTKLVQHVNLLATEVKEIKRSQGERPQDDASDSGQFERPQGPASSTKIAQRPDAGQSLNANAPPFRHVNFQDTFTFYGMDSCSQKENEVRNLQMQIRHLQERLAAKDRALEAHQKQSQTQMEELQERFQQTLQEQRALFSQQVEELRRTSAILSGQAANNPNTPPRRFWEGGVPSNSDSRNHESLSMGNNRQPDHRDIGQIVRRWNIRFSGEKGESIDLFLTRVEECRVLAQLSEADVLASLSELLNGVAATWFRNGRHQWKTWTEFRTAAQKWYGTSRRQQQRLMAEATARTQGEDEPVREYFTCIQAILRRITPPLEVGCQIDIMHANMNPDLQCMIPRDGLTEVDLLVEKAIDAELTLEAKRAYRPPPPAESCIMPEAAYKPKQPQQKKKAAPASGATQVAAVASDPMADALKAIAEWLDQMSKKMNQGQANGQQKKAAAKKNSSNGKGQKKKGNDEKADSDSEGERKGSKERKGPIPPEVKAKMKCFNCNKLGHLAYECPEPKENGKGSE